MKILTSTTEINNEILRLIEECSTCQIAVAWASSGFRASDLLLKHRTKMSRMIVGTHFYQTDPQFIENFLDHPNVRFIQKTDGVFHPMVYLFFNASGDWECLVGSPSFTNGGFGDNDKIAVLVKSGGTGAEKLLKNVQNRMDKYWNDASPISQSELVVYREAWKRKQWLVNGLAGEYGGHGRGDGGKNPLGHEPL